jgi:hypothetical protein
MFLVIPDAEKNNFLDTHMKMISKTYRDVGKTLKDKYDIDKSKK